ncbi:hypothetical protein EZY14_006015 [Kordia sp. TARA_039_SRF]|nr:hypothetical protein EZY14_006015 [Kordia sp. TARA_039_SRF]
MKDVNNLEEFLSKLDTLTSKSKSLIPSISYVTVNFDIELPIEKKRIDEKFKFETKNEFKFTRCIFKGVVKFKDNNSLLQFSCCIFYQINAEDVIFNNKIRFHGCNFHDINFTNATFKELADFWRSSFYKPTIFYRTNFLNNVVFSAAKFKENLLFTYTLIDKLIILRGTTVEKGIDLSLALINGEISVFDFKLKNFESFDVDEGIIEEINHLVISENNIAYNIFYQGIFVSNEEILEKHKNPKKTYNEVYAIKYEEVYESLVSEQGEIPSKNKRETFRIIKKVHESQNNIVESIPFRILEKQALKQELIGNYENRARRFEYNFFDKIVAFIDHYSNRFILTLNRLSNRYGKSYWQGAIFVLISGLLFFYFSLLSSEKYEFEWNPLYWSFESNDFKYYWQSLNPVHKHSYLDNLKPESYFYFWDYLGRIFVGYGIYQTIQAFRKYK